MLFPQANMTLWVISLAFPIAEPKSKHLHYSTDLPVQTWRKQTNSPQLVNADIIKTIILLSYAKCTEEALYRYYEVPKFVIVR